MEKRTIRNLKFRSIKEEHDLAKHLDNLHLKKKQAALQHDRAQSAFMKRYAALLQRKNGGLVSQRKKVPVKIGEDFVVSGAKISEKFGKRVPPRPEQISMSAVFEENVFASVSIGRADGTDFNVIPFSKPSTTVPVSHKANQLPVRARILSRSAPATRYANTELPTIREVSKLSRRSMNADIHQGVPGRYRAVEPDSERQVRKAWSPDLRVSSYRLADTEEGACGTVPSSHCYKHAPPPSDCQQIRGILIKKNSYSFQFCVNGIEDLQREILAAGRRRSSVPYDNNQLREQMRRFGGKKQVTFIESQIAGHEADGENPPRNLSGRFRGLNVVNILADRDGSNFIQQELCRGAPKVFAR